MYAGNAVIVNLLMRWPILIPVAAVAVSVTATQPPAPVAVQAVAAAQAPAPAPVPVLVAKPSPSPLEVICPPVNKTAKLNVKEKQALRDRGCKVKG